jgi:phage-related holin
MMAKANKAMSELNKQEQAAIAAGGAVVSYFLGWNEALEALLVLMVIDYLTGLLAAYICPDMKLNSTRS